jgi:hypothetical protein
MNSSAPSIGNHLLGIRDDLVGLLLPVILELRGHRGIRHRYDLCGQDGGVVAPVEADSGHRDPRGHLDDRQQGIHVDCPAHRHADDRLDCEGRHDPWERRG